MNMLNHRLVRNFLWMVPLFFSTLACTAASQWINPDTTTAVPQTFQPNPTDPSVLAPSTSPGSSAAACTALAADILRVAAYHSHETSGAQESGQEVGYLVVYTLDGDNLGTREDLLVSSSPGADLDSRSAHEPVWRYFASLIPGEERSFVTEFAVLSDGSNSILAGVSPTYADPNLWTLKVDIVDAGDPHSLTYTLLHEFGHFLTLKPSQVPPDSQVFYNLDDEAIYEQAQVACPTYFTGEGCSNPGSYIDSFFNRYWSNFYSEWQEVHPTKGGDADGDRLHEFYNMYKDQFLSSYAATSPEEDIAESWTYFVLSPKPEPTSIANQKILFFYEYPELVALREQILNRLCTSFPQN